MASRVEAIGLVAQVTGGPAFRADIGAVFVDKGLGIKRFTPQVTGGMARLRLDTHNPNNTSLLRGTEILSDVAFTTLSHVGLLAEAQLLERDRPSIGNHLYGAFGHDFGTSDGRRVMVVAWDRHRMDHDRRAGEGAQNAVGVLVGEDSADEMDLAAGEGLAVEEGRAGMIRGGDYAVVGLEGHFRARRLPAEQQAPALPDDAVHERQLIRVA